MKRVNFYLPSLYMNVLKNISKETGLSVSEHIRRAIDIYIGILRRDKDAWRLWDGEIKWVEKQ